MSHKKIEHSGNFYRQTVSLTSRALLFYFSHSLEIFLYLNTVWFTIRLVLLHDAWRVWHDMAWIEIGVGFGRVVLFCSVLYLSRGMYCVIIPFVRHCLNTFVLFFLCLFVGVCHCLLNVHMCSRYNSRDARAACRAIQIRPFPARWWVLFIIALKQLFILYTLK